MSRVKAPDALAGWWGNLAPRERTLVGFGLLLLASVVVYLALWQPPADGIRKLRADLPQLRTQDAALRAMSDEAAGLRTASGGTAASSLIAPAERLAAVRRSLQRAGLLREGAAPDAVPADERKVAPGTVSTLSVGGAVTTVSSATTTRTPPPEVSADGSERVRVRFDDIDYGVWVAWLAASEGELSARASRVSVVALAPKAPVGHVRAEVVLDWTPPPAAPARPA